MLSRSLRGIKSCRSLRGLRGGAGCIGGRARHSFLSEQDFLSDQAKNAVFVSVGRPTKIPGAPEVTGVAEVTGVTGLELSPASLEPPPFQHLRLGVQLAKYGVNLTKLAAEGQLEKVIGRDEELQQTIQILSRRRKNNPCLVGEAGVGKTSVAEGLAQMIYDGEVPESMAGKSVISLDLPSMLAGTKFRGEFEDRMKGVMKEIEMAGDKIILFIDEIHTMVGAGGSEGAIDASNILKPSLARGKLRCLGATTSDEYAKYIEKDPALARRFQSVYVPEPSAEHTVQILGGIRDKYETHHRVLIPPEAVESAVYLSGRYITSRRYPDKAIDLIDEAASRVRNRRERKPAALERLEKSLHDKLGEMDLAQAQAEAQAQKATGTKAPDTRPPAVGGGIDVDSGEAVDVTEVARLSAQRDALTAAWREKNKLVGLIFVAREERAQCVEQIKGLRRQLLPDKDSFLQNRVAQKENELRQYCVRLQQLAEDERRTAQIGTSDSGSSSGMGGGVSSSGAGAGTVAGAGADEDVEVAVRDALRSVGCEVGGEELAAIVAQSTGIPVSTMLGESEKKKLLGMEAELGRTLVGQAEAITAIARCIRLSRAGLRFHDRPLGVFLMIGPTGVGKTELAKALAELLFQDPQSSLLRIDMSEYMERFSVSRLIGAPPGYVGYEEGGVLTESVRRRPYQVILLDEFEKAHREVSNLLLQVFDEGRLTDSHGNVVDFRNTVIMMTSNLGSDVLGAMKEDPEEGEAGAGTAAGAGAGGDTGSQALKARKHEVAQRLVHSQFSPEFVNRLDDILVFNSLTSEAMARICRIQLRRVAELLRGRGVELVASEGALRLLALQGTDLRYGARPMKRLVQSALLNPLATLMLQERVAEGHTVVVTAPGEDPAAVSLVCMLPPLAAGAEAGAEAVSASIEVNEEVDEEVHMKLSDQQRGGVVLLTLDDDPSPGSVDIYVASTQPLP